MGFSRGIMELSFLSFIFFCMLFAVPSYGRYYTPPNVPRLTDLVPHVSIDQCFAKIFGASNIQLMNNGSSVNLTLDKVSGKFHLQILASSIFFSSPTLFSFICFSLFILEVLVWCRETNIIMDSSVLQLSFQQVSLQEL